MSARSKQKLPKVKEDIPFRKTPKTVIEPSTNNIFLSWHISLMEMVDPFGWHILGSEKLGEIREKLASFENRTWNEVLVQDKKHNHSVEVSDLCREAQDRLREIDQDDIDSLVSLRLTGRERIWGIRQQHVFKILWWDPDHQVCPSILKHT